MGGLEGPVVVAMPREEEGQPQSLDARDSGLLMICTLTSFARSRASLKVSLNMLNVQAESSKTSISTRNLPI